MSWTISQVKNGGWRTDARFVEVAAYDGAVAERDTLRKLNKESCEMAIKAYEERDALQARLDEAVKCLRGMFGDSPDVTRALDFLYTLENGGA